MLEQELPQNPLFGTRYGFDNQRVIIPMKRKKRNRKNRTATNAAGRKLMAAMAEIESAATTGDLSKLSIRHVRAISKKFSSGIARRKSVGEC